MMKTYAEKLKKLHKEGLAETEISNKFFGGRKYDDLSSQEKDRFDKILQMHSVLQSKKVGRVHKEMVMKQAWDGDDFDFNFKYKDWIIEGEVEDGDYSWGAVNKKGKEAEDFGRKFKGSNIMYADIRSKLDKQSKKERLESLMESVHKESVISYKGHKIETKKVEDKTVGEGYKVKVDNGKWSPGEAYLEEGDAVSDAKEFIDDMKK